MMRFEDDGMYNIIFQLAALTEPTPNSYEFGILIKFRS